MQKYYEEIYPEEPKNYLCTHLFCTLYITLIRNNWHLSLRILVTINSHKMLFNFRNSRYQINVRRFLMFVFPREGLLKWEVSISCWKQPGPWAPWPQSSAPLSGKLSRSSHAHICDSENLRMCATQSWDAWSYGSSPGGEMVWSHVAWPCSHRTWALSQASSCSGTRAYLLVS